MALIILRRMEFSLYQSTGGRWSRLFYLVQRKIPSALLNLRGLPGDALEHTLLFSPFPFFIFGRLKKNPIFTRRILNIGYNDFPTKPIAAEKLRSTLKKYI
ncbi:MAG: hypothetical protein ACLTSL_16315 [Odoribacter splanchnicus]